VARRSSAQATALLLPDLLIQLEWHSPLLLLEMAKWEAPSGGRDSLARLVPVKLEALRQDPLAKAMHLAPAKRGMLLAIRRLAKANLSSVKEDLDLDLRQTEQRLALVRRPAPRARLQDLRLRWAERFPVPSARARQYSKDPGPCASSPEIPVARKCNRAARCGGRPIFARYPPPRNRRALAGCGNKCSRSQHKRARRARPFPIAASDKYRCLPRRIAD
jgi:hypothetical protein